MMRWWADELVATNEPDGGTDLAISILCWLRATPDVQRIANVDYRAARGLDRSSAFRGNRNRESGDFHLAVSVLFHMSQHLFKCDNLSLKSDHSARQLGVGGSSVNRNMVSNDNRYAERHSHLAIIDPNDPSLDDLLLFRNVQLKIAGKQRSMLESQLGARFGNIAHDAILGIILIAQANKATQKTSLSS